MRKVKIKKTGGAANETSAKMFNGVQQSWPTIMNQFSKPDTETNNTLKPVDESEANLEAENGERVIINQQGITTNFRVGGKRHSEGGTPLNLPDNSFIFSDTKDMKIKDPAILSQFGISSGSITPADIAEKYDINKYRKTLADPDSTDLDRDTAEMMIANYNLKLAKLALIQESKKGFPQGIPSIAMPYIETMGVNPGDFLNTQSQPTPMNPDMAKFGGSLPKAQQGLEAQIKKAADERIAKQQEWNQYYTESILDAQKQREENILRNTYLKAQERIKAGDIEPFMDWLPWNTPSATTYLEGFKEAAKRYGKDPNQLLKQYDQEYGYVKKENPYVEVKPKTPTATDTTGYAAAKALFGKKEYGGEYQKGGKTGQPHPLGGTAYQWEDGAITWVKKDGTEVIVEKGDPNWKPKPGSTDATSSTKPGAKPTTPGKLDVYTPTFTEALAKRYGQNKLTPEQIKYHMPFDVLDPEGNIISERMIKTVPGMQTTRKSGAFGEQEWWSGQYKSDFERRHKDLIEKYKKETGKDFDPTTLDAKDPKGRPASSAVLWFEKEYNKQAAEKGLPAYDFGSPGKLGSLTWHAPSLGEHKPEEGVIAKEEKAVEEANTAVKPAAMATATQQGHDPWWLQDIIKTAGAAGDFFRVKKYSPWQATPGVTLPEPTFYDPTRELAANAEFAHIGAQGQMAFTNPQAFAAAYSAIQGQGAKNAADILGRYNNLNVGVANDFELKRTDIMNQNAATRAGLATQLADKYTILNQQFDNSKNMARQNLRQSYIDAVTNKNYTGNLNDLYEQYKIDPLVGGRIKWTHGRPVTPEDTSKEDMFNRFSELRQKFPKTVSDESIWKYVTGEKGGKDSSMV